MRRELTEQMRRKLIGDVKAYPETERVALSRGSVFSRDKSAYFRYFSSVTEKALSYFDRIFLPLTEYAAHLDAVSRNEKIGIAFPPVAFDHELCEVRALAVRAKEAGCREALVPGLWQARLSDEIGFCKHGDLRLNVYNSESLSVYAERGFASVVLSPEIGVSASVGIGSEIPKGYVIYGRLPLMTMEKCVIRDMALPKLMSAEKCSYCETHPFSHITDRKGTVFPITREFRHRNVIWNSVPTYMADKPLTGLFSHAIFTDEKPHEVDAIVEALEKKLPPNMKFRRL
jgi:putative protease